MILGIATSLLSLIKSYLTGSTKKWLIIGGLGLAGLGATALMAHGCQKPVHTVTTETHQDTTQSTQTHQTQVVVDQGQKEVVKVIHTKTTTTKPDGTVIVQERDENVGVHQQANQTATTDTQTNHAEQQHVTTKVTDTTGPTSVASQQSFSAFVLAPTKSLIHGQITDWQAGVEYSHAILGPIWAGVDANTKYEVSADLSWQFSSRLSLGVYGSINIKDIWDHRLTTSVGLTGQVKLIGPVGLVAQIDRSLTPYVGLQVSF